MNIESHNTILKDLIKSNNDVIEFKFSFVTPKTGTVNAYDNSLGVNISGQWEIAEENGQILIKINGFNVPKFGPDKFICQLKDLVSELKQIDSAYDLVGGS